MLSNRNFSLSWSPTSAKSPVVFMFAIGSILVKTKNLLENF